MKALAGIGETYKILSLIILKSTICCVYKIRCISSIMLKSNGVHKEEQEEEKKNKREKS